MRWHQINACFFPWPRFYKSNTCFSQGRIKTHVFIPRSYKTRVFLPRSYKINACFSQGRIKSTCVTSKVVSNKCFFLPRLYQSTCFSPKVVPSAYFWRRASARLRWGSPCYSSLRCFLRRKLGGASRSLKVTNKTIAVQSRWGSTRDQNLVSYKSYCSSTFSVIVSKS